MGQDGQLTRSTIVIDSRTALGKSISTLVETEYVMLVSEKKLAQHLNYIPSLINT